MLNEEEHNKSIQTVHLQQVLQQQQVADIMKWMRSITFVIIIIIIIIIIYFCCLPRNVNSKKNVPYNIRIVSIPTITSLTTFFYHCCVPAVSILTLMSIASLVVHYTIHTTFVAIQEPACYSSSSSSSTLHCDERGRELIDFFTFEVVNDNNNNIQHTRTCSFQENIFTMS